MFGAQAAAELEREIAESREVQETLWRAAMLSRFAGSLMVTDFELPKLREPVSLRNPTPGTPLVRMDLVEAAEHFRRRLNLSPDEFAELSDAMRQQAWTATRAMGSAVRERMYDHLMRAIQGDEETGLREFIREFRSRVDAGDLPGGARGYVSNVFRTSTATSYAAGRLAAQRRAQIRYMEFLTANDERVRPEHAKLHGKRFRADDPALGTVYPPLSWQCRCTMIALDPEDVTESDLGAASEFNDVPDQGFAALPQ